jgi:hypothetical protein
MGPVAGVSSVAQPRLSQANSEKGANTMRTNTFILASLAVSALVSSAAAGPCTTEIENLAKVLASRDAGSGPTPGASGDTHPTAQPTGHPPTAAMSEAAKGTATSAEDVRRQTAGQPTAVQQGSGETPTQHPPTEAMSQATRSQTAPVTTGQHPPTAAMSEATRTQAAPPASTPSTGDASAALNRARMLDQQGKEAECMEAVRQAKQH